MQLSHKAVTSFQKLYQEKRGVWLEYEKAQVKALEELKQFALIYRPVPKSDQDYFLKLGGKN